MKPFKNAAILANGLLLTVMLGACQTENENALEPQIQSAVNDRNSKTSAEVLLIKDAGTTLTYATQGRATLLYETNQSGIYWTYTYGSQTITSAKYAPGNNQPMGTDSYTLDANGKCIQSITDKTFIYEYNADGQLTKCYNKFQPSERIECFYEPDIPGSNLKSLTKVSFYNQFDQKKREITYSYYIGNPKPDLNPQNPEWLPGCKKYLPVYGKFNNYHIKLMVDNTIISSSTILTSGYLHDYVMDAAGRPKTVTIKKTDGSSASTIERKYLYPLAGI